ncbi:MAG: 6-carboxytetrahydropterin synthase [Bdellovibrio sp.]
MILILKSSFSSAHFYSQPQWSENKNREIFGRCYTPNGHGHNYTVEVGLLTNEDSYLIDKAKHKVTLEKLADNLDHKHLNFDILEFKDKNPTTENIALYFLDKLKETISEKKISYIKLYEMDNLWTEIHL